MMIRAENLIVEGKYFIPYKNITEESVTKIKRTITGLLASKGYNSEDPTTIFFQNSYLTLVFIIRMQEYSVPLSLRVKNAFRLISDADFKNEEYMLSLKHLRDDVPFRVTIYMGITALTEQEGLDITIRTEPAILFKMRQLRQRDQIDEFDLSTILENNKQMIRETMLALGAIERTNPKSLIELEKTPVTSELKKAGFNRVAEILEKGRSKLISGSIEDGLTDLRAALEVFTSELVTRTGGEAASQDKVKENLNKLKDKGYVEPFVFDLILDVIYKKMYVYLSNKPVHKREHCSKLDAEFLFSVVESFMKIMMEKVVHRGN